MKRAAQGWGTELELYLAHTKPEAGSPGGWEPTEEDEPVRSKGQRFKPISNGPRPTRKLASVADVLF